MPIPQEQVSEILDALSPAQARWWSRASTPLGDDFTPEAWDASFQTFLASQRPDLLEGTGTRDAEGAFRALALYEGDAARTGLALDDLERQVGLRSLPGAPSHARASQLASRLSQGIVLSRGAIAGILVVAALALLAIRHVAARRRQASSPAALSRGWR